MLDGAADTRVPLIERLGLAAIYCANVDEFFRVRVIALRRLVRSPERTRRQHILEPARLLADVLAEVVRQQRRLGQVIRDVLGRLDDEGIRLVSADRLPEEALEFAIRYFEEYAAAHVHPIILEHFTDTPPLKNGELYLAVPLWPRGESDGMVAFAPAHGLVEVPSDHLPRFVPVFRNATHRHVMFLDDIVRVSLASIYSQHDPGGAYAIRMERPAVGQNQKALRKRDSDEKRATKGLPARFTYDRRTPYPVLNSLLERTGFTEDDLEPGGRYHDLADLARFPDFGRSDLLYRART